MALTKPVVTSTHDETEKQAQRYSEILRRSISNSAFRTSDPIRQLLWSCVGKIIGLGGLPCSGKTTLGEALSALFAKYDVPCLFVPEEVDKEHLGEFYRHVKEGTKPNPEAWPFQLNAMLACISNYKIAQIYSGKSKLKCSPHVVILDRPILENRVFEQMHVECGNISAKQHGIYDNNIIKNGPYELDAYVYLHVRASICHNRIIKVRKNEEEKDVPLEYLQSLELMYITHLLKYVEERDRSLYVINNESMFFSQEQLIGLLKDTAKTRVPPVLENPAIEYTKDRDNTYRVMDCIVEHYQDT